MNTDIIILVILFVFILLLILLMFSFLKRIVEKINKISKEYYLDKVQVYDNLIQEKENRLNELNDEIEKRKIEKEEDESKDEIIESKNDSSEYEVNIKKVDYQDENILQQVKTIDEKFNLNEEELIKKFIERVSKNQSFEKYNELKNYQDKLNSKVCYEMSSKNAKEQEEFLRNLFKNNQEIINDFMKENKKMNIIVFRPYLDKILAKEDPFIYVYVSDKNKNYDYISNKIQTIYDNRIYRGIMIKYKNRMYDFCIK